MGYALNFVIPAGPTGPMGPKGENGTTGLNAYGGKYTSSNQKINLGILTPTEVPLISNMPSYNMNYSNNGITISLDGVYEINYQLSFNISNDTQVYLYIRKNTDNIEFLTVNKNLLANTNNVFNGSTIMNLNKDDTIHIYLASQSSISVTFSEGNGAILIIKKIN